MTQPTYDAYHDEHPDASFTDWLRELSEPSWTGMVAHRFVEEIGAGTIDDEVFARYLVQDYAFVENLLGLIGHAVGDAPSIEQKRQINEFLSWLLEEDDDGYFERTFDKLGVPEGDRTEPEKHPVTEGFEDIFARGAREGGYEETLAVLFPTGWAYLEWATSIADSDPGTFYLREWIEIHTHDILVAFVDWQHRELNRLGPELSERRQRQVGRHFRRTMDLEKAFFDIAYEP